MKEMKGYKKYRIDSFSDKKHDNFYFDSENDAICIGKELSNRGNRWKI